MFTKSLDKGLIQTHLSFFIHFLTRQLNMSNMKVTWLFFRITLTCFPLELHIRVPKSGQPRGTISKTFFLFCFLGWMGFAFVTNY